MAIFNVTNLFDSGAGSLRQAILDANVTAGADEIQFSSISGTITLTSGELNITDSLTINGIGADLLTVSGNNSSEVFDIDDGTSNVIDVYLNGLTVSNGYYYAIVNQGNNNLTITNSTITDTEGAGAGILNYGSGTLNVTNSTITGNEGFFVGGIRNLYGTLNVTNSTITGNEGYFSGGIYSNGSTTITNSTISGNSASNSGGGITVDGITTITNSTISDNQGYVQGGGIRQTGNSTLTITNSTISNNQVTTTRDNPFFGGGGIFSWGSVTLTNSTISGNSTANGDPAGIFIDTFRGYYSPSLELSNTIIANSVNGADCVNTGATIITNTNNLIEDGTCNPALSRDPNLGPLQDNGGPTFTQALLPGSIAIDAGSNAAIPLGILTDQRGPGFPRIINGTVDIGAYEASPNVPPVPEPSSLFGIITLGLVAVGSLRRRRK